MKKKRRLKKSVLTIIVIVIITIILIFMGVNYYKKVTSYKYKLSKIGYNENEVGDILKLKKDQIDDILKRKYNKIIPKLLDKPHFIYKNLDKYLAYYDKHKSEKKELIVTKVNIGADKDFYSNASETIDDGNLILVNKYNYLTKEFKVDDLEDVSILHMYGKQKLRKEAYDKFKEMFNAAKEENITIIINSSFREYEYQQNLWNNYASQNGEAWADSYAARAGYSEHETGLAIDVTTYGVKKQEDFEKTEAFTWLTKNAHKYGFILRYPKGKENITGYAYEPWHYRYLGVEVATKVYESDLTYDEYYAYYIKK